MTLERPRLPATDGAFASRLPGNGVTRTNALESLVIAGFVRGLSMRDVEATLAEAPGAQAALAKSTVSRICEAINTEFDAWRQRDRRGLELDHLFADGTFCKMHPNAAGKPVLCVWGIITDGRNALVGSRRARRRASTPGRAASATSRSAALRPSLLGITDGAPRLIAAFCQAFPGSLRQGCVVHRARKRWPRRRWRPSPR